MDDYLQRLERLAGLFERGTLTKEEFEAEKSRLLQYGAQTLHVEPDAPAPSPKLNRRNTLFIAGALTVALGVILGVAVWRDLSLVAKPIDTPEAPSTEKTSSISLEDLIRFSDAKSCVPAGGLSELLRRMDEAAASDPGSTERLLKLKGFTPQFEVDAALHGSENKEALTARIIIRRPWHGLRVTELRSTQWADATGVQIRFQEPLTQTAAVLRSLGFHIPAVGKLAPTDTGFVGLEWVGQETALTCVRAARDRSGDTALGVSEKGVVRSPAALFTM